MRHPGRSRAGRILGRGQSAPQSADRSERRLYWCPPCGLRSAAAQGMLEEPGIHVAQKSGLNKAILDQGWGMFRRLLEYKQRWRGGEVIAVNPRYTSQTCPACRHVSPQNRPQQALFSCQQCGYSYHADVVAAQNILARGQRERLNAYAPR